MLETGKTIKKMDSAFNITGIMTNMKEAGKITNVTDKAHIGSMKEKTK